MDWTAIPTYAYVYNLGCAEDDKGNVCLVTPEKNMPSGAEIR